MKHVVNDILRHADIKGVDVREAMFRVSGEKIHRASHARIHVGKVLDIGVHKKDTRIAAKTRKSLGGIQQHQHRLLVEMRVEFCAKGRCNVRVHSRGVH